MSEEESVEMLEEPRVQSRGKNSSGPAILPGAMLGVIGGGQLGRMFALAARRMGYRVAVWSDEVGPATECADQVLIAHYSDLDAGDPFFRPCPRSRLKRKNCRSICFDKRPSLCRSAPGSHF